MLRDAGEVMAAFESLVALPASRAGAARAGSALDDPRAERFHRRVIPLLLAEGRLRMIRLSADMRTVAVFYGLAVGPWWGYYLAGYDREWAGRIHLGQITLAAAIDLAVARRRRGIRLPERRGAGQVSLAGRERIAMDADVYSDRSGPQSSRASRAARDTAIAFVKSATGLRHHVESGFGRTRHGVRR